MSGDPKKEPKVLEPGVVSVIHLHRQPAKPNRLSQAAKEAAQKEKRTRAQRRRDGKARFG